VGIDMLDLSRSAVAIPVHLRDVRYTADHFPGAPNVLGVEGGANCQQYAYAVVRHHGFILPDLRSDELWLDRDYTAENERMEPFDLVLVHDNPDSWGAHVGLCVGADLVLHLSKKIGVPAIETLAELQRRDAYRYLIGYKRPLGRVAAEPS
jgi:murein DD-endopeptidase / murein LD-carboxypeptidase